MKVFTETEDRAELVFLNIDFTPFWCNQTFAKSSIVHSGLSSTAKTINANADSADFPPVRLSPCPLTVNSKLDFYCPK
jgi:hypothetical protein